MNFYKINEKSLDSQEWEIDKSYKVHSKIDLCTNTRLIGFFIQAIQFASFQKNVKSFINWIVTCVFVKKEKEAHFVMLNYNIR